MVSPNYTMELLYQTLYKLRTAHHFNGYIHVKAIPGADPLLIEKTGFLADRMSINLELPTADSLKKACALQVEKYHPEANAHGSERYYGK